MKMKSLEMKNLEMKIVSKKLINEVKSRPTLWDIAHADYNDRMRRLQCWEQIIDIFAQENITADDRRKLGELLQKKWKNIRDRFAREHKYSKSKYNIRKKAPYLYTEQLTFLTPSLHSRKSEKYTQKLSKLQNTLPERKSLRYTAPSDLNMAIDQEDLSSNIETTVMAAIPKLESLDADSISIYHVEDENLRALSTNSEEIINSEDIEPDDDNRQFLLSLLPSLKSLPRLLNTSCRIELMQCLSKYEIQAHQESPQLQQEQQYDSIKHSN